MGTLYACDQNVANLWSKLELVQLINFQQWTNASLLQFHSFSSLCSHCCSFAHEFFFSLPVAAPCQVPCSILLWKANVSRGSHFNNFVQSRNRSRFPDTREVSVFMRKKGALETWLCVAKSGYYYTESVFVSNMKQETYSATACFGHVCDPTLRRHGKLRHPSTCHNHSNQALKWTVMGQQNFSK